MPIFKADIHLHSVLSPCGDLEMSPRNIVETAKKKNIDIIGITDHNTTKHTAIISKYAKENEILALKGVEITTKEDVHCLAFFEKDEEIQLFQEYLETNLPKIKNNVDLFGYQVVVDEEENIVEEIEWLLISAINQNIEQVGAKVYELNGIFIPAHINKSKDSVISQLGFIPLDMRFDALEISKHISLEKFLNSQKYLKNFTFVQNSDAHFIDDIGSTYTLLDMEDLTFSAFKTALKNNKTEVANK